MAASALSPPRWHFAARPQRAHRRGRDLPAKGDGEAGEDPLFVGAKTFLVQFGQNGPLAEREAVAGKPHLAQKRAAPGAGPVVRSIVKPHGKSLPVNRRYNNPDVI